MRTRQLDPSIIATPTRRKPRLSLGAVKDRSMGAILGLALGDAVGTTLEFKPRDHAPLLTDLVGGGPFRLKAGQWTDDTSMAIALADSLLFDSALDEADLMTRFTRWLDNGDYSVLGHCFDIGATTRAALTRWKQTGNALAGSTSPDTAGNGSLMRLAPVAVRHWSTPAIMRDVAARQSATTHGAPEAIDACVAFSEVLADAISGRPKSEVMRSRSGPYRGAIAEIMAGSWRGKQRHEIFSSGYVAHSLEAALWCANETTDFRDAVLLAANLGEDADTTAAITGQLAGAMYGVSGLPKTWLCQLAWKDRISTISDKLATEAVASIGNSSQAR